MEIHIQGKAVIKPVVWLKLKGKKPDVSSTTKKWRV